MNYGAFAYLPILIFLIIGILLGGLLIIISSVLVAGSQDTEKRMPYECGFESFGDARISFDVRFYLVTLLFIIFDLEIAFLFPWAIAFKKLGLLGFWSMMVFLFILTIGFIYEWNKGALEWE